MHTAQGNITYRVQQIVRISRKKVNVDISDSPQDRLNLIIELSWDILLKRIASGITPINKESSMQLLLSVIIHGIGELLCLGPEEIFTIELESNYDNKNIYLTCNLENCLNGKHTKAAIELKCFWKSSNKAKEFDMYDVWKDIERLIEFDGFDVRKFICFTDDQYYRLGNNAGHASIVSTKENIRYSEDSIIQPVWVDKSYSNRSFPITLNKDVALNWKQIPSSLKNREHKEWNYLFIDL